MKFPYKKPLAITMWDFSWLERRWSGAGYEDWNQVLDELIERGYDAVRIDVYPHLLSADGEREWTLLPHWNQQVWGAASLIRVSRIADHLIEFMSICKQKGIAVGLSTWFRQDEDNLRMNIKTPADLARIWKDTLDVIENAGLMDIVLFVDLVNEYPHPSWTPFLYEFTDEARIPRDSKLSVDWMKQSLDILRSHYPDLNYTFSDCSLDGIELRNEQFLDVLEPHIWMTKFTDFYKRVGYNFELFESTGYDNLALHASRLYNENKSEYHEKLLAGIDLIAEWAREQKRPLITTECWAIVDWKDWPLLDWNIIKEMCEIGVERAVSKGMWVAISTSNFCGPQFVGMWRDIAWHKRLTDLIHQGELPQELIIG